MSYIVLFAYRKILNISTKEKIYKNSTKEVTLWIYVHVLYNAIDKILDKISCYGPIYYYVGNTSTWHEKWWFFYTGFTVIERGEYCRHMCVDSTHIKRLCVCNVQKSRRVWERFIEIAYVFTILCT